MIIMKSFKVVAKIREMDQKTQFLDSRSQMALQAILVLH